MRQEKLDGRPHLALMDNASAPSEYGVCGLAFAVSTERLNGWWSGLKDEFRCMFSHDFCGDIGVI